MGKAKKGKHRLDKFYYLAKEQGYRSRAAFKLVQLDRKYNFLNSAQSLLDLCAAPGGWMQVAVKSMPVGAVVIGVDLVPIRPIRGALTLQEDITTPKCASEITKLLKQRGVSLVDVVLHDGSPNVGGAWSKEAVSQASLVLDSLKLATKFLAPRGTFVTKVFRSQDYSSLLFAFKKLFEKVEVTKPLASRTTSAEIYVVGLKYQAPANVDPKLLDARHLFQEIAEPPKVVDVLRGTKQKRHRDGYEENTTFRKVCSAKDFVWSEKPLELLGTVTCISFEDPDSASVKKCPQTTEEIIALCEDLKLLGKREFKQILKWRLQVRKVLSAQSQNEKDTSSEEEKEKEEEDDEDTLNKLEELKTIMESKDKQAKKKASKRKQKVKARTRTGMQMDVTAEDYGEAELFSLGSIKAKKDLNRVEDHGEEELDAASASDDEILNGAKRQKEDEDSDMDSDAEREKYDAELESYLDRAYDRYRAKKEGSAARRKRARMTASDDEEVLEDSENEQTGTENDRVSDREEEEANPLLVSLPKPRLSKEQLAEKWFSQQIFAGVDGGEEMQADTDKEVVRAPKAPAVKKSASSVKSKTAGKSAKEDDFEVVPAEETDTSSDDDEYDSDTKAEILTYAKKMLRKKDRENIIDDSYNRYMFNDEGLPEWFADDEKKHCRIEKPYTKAELEAMKARFNSIDARPVKKVAEAKARKKRIVKKRMDQARSKATAIAEQPDISNKSKNRMMEKVYKKAAAATRRPKRELVVAKKGVNVRGGKGKVVVDRRMKKDTRSRGSGKLGKGKGKGRGGKGGKTKSSGAKGGKGGKAFSSGAKGGRN